jgi:cytochrome b6-f complex iron-sulfur subunit
MATTPDNNELPNWKSDFPIQQDEATHISRREFAKFLCLLSGGFALSNGLIVANSYANPKKELEGEHFICNTADVPVGEMKMFTLNNDKDIPYILIHLEEGKWRAFEQKCTHLSCAVRYRHDINKIECPCHSGYFNAETGAVLQGPPPRPLPQLQVVIRDEKIYVVAYKEAPVV